jgi:hypothetical protein
MGHTKGPWAIGMETDEETGQVIASDGSHLARVESYPVMENTLLIAAAPELLEACKALILRFDRACDEGRCNPVFLESERASMRAAIAKAEGK